MQKSTVLEACSQFGGCCRVKFTENGWECLEDNRDCKDGYLHISNDSADAITEPVRNQIVRYFYQHDKGLPGIGATAQQQYFIGLSREDMERIGAGGEVAYYNR